MKLLLAAAALLVAAPPSVDKLILRPAQVGKGYVLVQRTDGAGVAAARTLDLCGTTNYPSEKLRTTRLQVDYLKKGASIGISNEVVTYRGNGAAQAMREVTEHATTCPHHAISPGEQGLPPLLFTITKLTDRKLLKGYLAVKVRVTGKVKGQKVDQTSYAVYQRLGTVLSGVYSFGPDTDAQRILCLHAAEQSARVLRAGAAAGGGPSA